MLLGGAETGEDFHHIVDFLFLFGTSLIESILLLEIKQFAADDKLLSSNAFSKLVVVDVDKSELHLLFFLAIVVVELHLS